MTAKYRVISDRIAGHDLGDTVTDTQLGDANVDALVASQHLEKIKATVKKAAGRKGGA